MKHINQSFYVREDQKELLNNFKKDAKLQKISLGEFIFNLYENEIFLSKWTRKKLGEVFEINEFLLMCDSWKGSIYQKNMTPKNQAFYSLEDSINLDKLDIKFEVNKDKFLQKVKELTVYEAYTLIMAITNNVWGELFIENLEEKIKEVFFL